MVDRQRFGGYQQHVLEDPPDELVGRDGHGAPAAAAALAIAEAGGCEQQSRRKGKLAALKAEMDPVVRAKQEAAAALNAQAEAAEQAALDAEAAREVPAARELFQTAYGTHRHKRYEPQAGLVSSPPPDYISRDESTFGRLAETPCTTNRNNSRSPTC